MFTWLTLIGGFLNQCSHHIITSKTLNFVYSHTHRAQRHKSNLGFSIFQLLLASNLSINSKATSFTSHRGLMAAANNSANAPTPLEREQIFGMAEKEMEYRVELFNKLTHTCFNKCVEKRYKESELNMGENSCIDRCVSKYWHVTNLIGQLLGSGRPPM